MSTPPYASGSSWSWPKEEPAIFAENVAPIPGSYERDEYSSDEDEQPLPEESNGENGVPKSHKHYAPRTCRICLEVVLPTFEPATEGLPGLLSAPRVTYVSQDPESGRLIRPCKCKGSQRYVHEGCLQAWRHSDPAYGRRNYWECPTCKFRYRLERIRWSRWISSTATQLLLTVLILFITVFVLGFIADPILNLYFDPMTTLTTNPLSSTHPMPPAFEDDGESWWTEHILKGLASLGLLGFVKMFFAMGPWQWYNLRNSGMLPGSGRNGRGGTGRDRLENISWYLIALGVMTFLWAVWKGVRAWSRRTLEKAGERGADVQGDDDDDDEDEGNVNPAAEHDSSAKKDL